MSSRFERYWHAVFEFGVLFKAFNGIWETIVGVFVLLFNKSAFNSTLNFLARREILEDPHDTFIDFVSNALQNLSANAVSFAAIYILLHGLLNIFLAIQLYRNKLWAYVATMSAMSVFIIYQIYRISLHHSISLTIITIYDILFIILTLHEYRYQKSIN